MLIEILLFLLATIISGNNSALILGPLNSSRIMGKFSGSLFISFFMSIGLILEGMKMLPPVHILSSYVSIIYISVLVVFVIFSILSYPLSAGMVFTGSLLGFSLITKEINYSYYSIVFISWIIAFLISLLLGFIIYIFIERINKPFKGYSFYILFLLSSAFLSYTLGSNTIGLIYSISPLFSNLLSSILGIFFGTFIFNFLTYKTVTKSIVNLNAYRSFVSQLSSSIVVESFTQVHIPVSITQGVVGSMVGSGLKKGYREINLVKVNQLIFSWVTTPILSMFITVLILLV